MDETKQTKIIAAATKVFAEKGYQYATMADIARQAGVSTGNTYSCFEGKLDLLLSIICRFWKQVNAVNQQKMQALHDPLEKLYSILHTFEEQLFKDEDTLYIVKVLNEALPHLVMIKEERLQHKRQEIIKENRTLIDMIDAIIASGQQQCVFDSELSPSVMRQVLCGTIERVIYGLFFKSSSGQEIGYDAREAHRAMQRLIEKFICKQAT